MRLRTMLLAAASLALAAAPASAHSKTPARAHHKAPRHHAAAAGQRGVSIVMDEVRVITFPRPVATVFLGNPIIADATMIDSYHAFLLGKTFGVTNLVALNAQNQTIVNQQITVANRGGGVVTLNKGTAQFTYSCAAGHCEASPRPGDQKTFFDDTEAAISGHQDQSIKAASVAAPH